MLHLLIMSGINVHLVPANVQEMRQNNKGGTSLYGGWGLISICGNCNFIITMEGA